MKLRVHHLLCSALFTGKGYSEAFVENMQGVVDELFMPEEADTGKRAAASVELCLEPDIVCKECPNLADGVCILDDNNVVSKDAGLARKLGLECNREYRKKELFGHIARTLSEDIFEESCHKCRWYEEGLCRYDALLARYDEAAADIESIKGLDIL